MALICYWSRSRDTRRNFGDALNPCLLGAISGQAITHYDDANLFKQRLSPVLYGMGSILERRRSGLSHRVQRVHVWGTGTRGSKSLHHWRGATIHAVRGPLTRQRLQEKGITCPECYGDPALLLPRLLPIPAPSGETSANQKPTVVVVPHYVDQQFCRQWLKNHGHPANVRVIDVFDEPVKILCAISEADFVLSSSLHGLIVADAYGVANSRISFSDAVSGGDFKFNDYALSVDRQPEGAIDMQQERCFGRALDRAILGNTAIADTLASAFPEQLKLPLRGCDERAAI